MDWYALGTKFTTSPPLPAGVSMLWWVGRAHASHLHNSKRQEYHAPTFPPVPVPVPVRWMWPNKIRGKLFTNKITVFLEVSLKGQQQVGEDGWQPRPTRLNHRVHGLNHHLPNLHHSPVPGIHHRNHQHLPLPELRHCCDVSCSRSFFSSFRPSVLCERPLLSYMIFNIYSNNDFSFHLLACSMYFTFIHPFHYSLL